MKKLFLVLFTAATMGVLLWEVQSVQAFPVFARKYKTSCSTCHYAFPKLNAFGKAFKNNGFRYPAGTDEEMRKEEPVSLGSEAYKKVFPDAIWPTDIPGTPPLAFRAIGRFLKFDKNTEDGKSSFEMPHELALLFAGTFDDHISYHGEIEFEHAAEIGYDFKVQYDFSPAAHLAFGTVGLNHMMAEDLRLTANHYNIVNLRNQSGTWRIRSGAAGGIELWGAGNGPGGRGGFTYAAGVGNGQRDGENYDKNKSKDFYGRVTYKIGGLGEIGGTEGQGSSTSAFYIDNSFRIGGFAYSGTAVASAGDDDFSVIGGDIDWWFNRLNVVAAAMQMKSTYAGFERKSFTYFSEANYVLYPWLIAYARYEFTDKNTDDNLNAQTTILPAIVAMVRANVKCSLEYKIPLDSAGKNTGGLIFQVDFGL